MQTSNPDQESRSKDLAWYLLGEYSLSKFLSDSEKEDKLKAGFLSQTVRELSIPPEYVENIEMMLTGFTKEAFEHFKQGGVKLPGRIRIFCKQKMIEKEMKGGWGYFVIERSRDSSTNDCTEPFHFIDLYFYGEGE
jgi:hypothetical protein